MPGVKKVHVAPLENLLHTNGWSTGRKLQSKNRIAFSFRKCCQLQLLFPSSSEGKKRGMHSVPPLLNMSVRFFQSGHSSWNPAVPHYCMHSYWVGPLLYGARIWSMDFMNIASLCWRFSLEQKGFLSIVVTILHHFHLQPSHLRYPSFSYHILSPFPVVSI